MNPYTSGEKQPQETLPSNEAERTTASLTELALLFTKLGTTAFGGPAAHIAMMNDEVVKKRNWLTQQKFLDMLGATNLIPGPNSTEMAIHIGLEQAGWWGLLVAGLCFILPATFIVWGLAILYVQFQTKAELGWLMYGIKPVVIAIIIQAVWRLHKVALKNTAITGIFVVTLALSIVGVNEILLLLLGAGIVGTLIANWQKWKGKELTSFWLLPAPQFATLATQVSSAGESTAWLGIFLVFLKIGAVLYGSGYVLFAFLQSELVERLHWLTSQQIIDAIAIGQFTPGPVFTSATFVGYLLAGHTGAIAATVGIFLPAFIGVAAIKPIVKWARSSSWAASFLDSLNAVSLALMVAVIWQLGQTAITNWLTAGLAILSLLSLLRWEINSVCLIIVGGLIGLIFHKSAYY